MSNETAQLLENDSGLDGAVADVQANDLPTLFSEFAAARLTWWPEIGVGYLPICAGVSYDDAYFQHYVEVSATTLGFAINAERVRFVERHWRGNLTDVGIGSGAFITARNAVHHKTATWGFDVNPAGDQWLQMRALKRNPYIPQDAISLWDVLEHIPDFPALISNVRKWVFVSIPIFQDVSHVLRSKHFKPGEHCWYFTALGLIHIFDGLGFDCIEMNDAETRLGREDIGCFAFQRRMS
jgi:hypothetical protein